MVDRWGRLGPRAGIPKRMRPNCHKKVISYQRGSCTLTSAVPIPQRPQQELEELRLEEGEPSTVAAVETEPERQEGLRVDTSAKKDKRLKSNNTKSDTLGSNPKAARERARSHLQNGYHISTSLGARYTVPSIVYPRYVYLWTSDAEARGLRQHLQTVPSQRSRSRTRRLRRHADVIVE